MSKENQMSAEERMRRYEMDKNRLLYEMRGHSAKEIQEALQKIIEKWKV